MIRDLQGLVPSDRVHRGGDHVTSGAMLLYACGKLGIVSLVGNLHN
jgi:hypothetical protein